MIVDFHSHILPDVDDGSRNESESLRMLEMLRQQGADCVVATPHFYGSRDLPERFLDRRQRALDRLMKEAARVGCTALPEIRLGAEVAYFRGMSRSRVLQDLAVEGTRALLVELPFGRWNRFVYEELELIHREQDLIPVVAHIDRYLQPFRTAAVMDRLAELPVLVQANAEFFVQKKTRRRAMSLLKKDLIHLLGSDCHNLGDRAPNLGAAVSAVREALGPEALERMEGWQMQVFGAQKERLII